MKQLDYQFLCKELLNLIFSKYTEISTISGLIVISPGAMETSSKPYACCNAL